MSPVAKYKEIEEKAMVAALTVEGHYDAKKNVTRIEKKLKEKEDKDEKESKKVLPGLVIIKLSTDNGEMGINY